MKKILELLKINYEDHRDSYENMLKERYQNEDRFNNIMMTLDKKIYSI